ncbi:unnamed protein product [Rhodiola kirilowii]
MFCLFSSLKFLRCHKIRSQFDNSTSNRGSMKLKAILRALIASHIRRAIHSLSKMKLIIIDIKDIFLLGHLNRPKFNTRNVRKTKKTRTINLHGSFRLHYNWCSSSHVAPEPPNTTILEAKSSDGIFFPVDDSSELPGYLHWLDEKREIDEANEIDKLAEMFIANCHEKFWLEKQESYRMFQEMMARSI